MTININVSHTHAEKTNKCMKKDWKKTHLSVKSGCLWMVRLKIELMKIIHPGIVRKNYCDAKWVV